MKNDLQNATRKISGDLIEIKEGYPDTISFWIAAYFRFEVTTSKSSQKVQKRDLDLFRDFMINDCGRENRSLWSPRLSKAFAESFEKKGSGHGKGRVQRPDYQPHPGPSENPGQVDPQAQAVSLGQPHGKDEADADRKRPGDRAGHFVRRTPAHFRCGRYLADRRWTLQRPSPLSGQRAAHAQRVPALSQPGHRLHSDRNRDAPGGGQKLKP